MDRAAQFPYNEGERLIDATGAQVAQRPIGPYLIEQRLATGGMAEVFVVRRVGAHGFFKRLALKRILPQLAKDPDFVQMFIDEARLAGRLEHPNIVQVFDFGELSGDLFLAMELVDGANVNRLLRAVAARGQTVPVDAALHIASETAHALAYAHALCDDTGQPLNLIHRDVSPANILLTRTGHVKLADFGIARIAERDTRTDTGHVRGKLGYMSPEQVMGRELDGRSDVFTLTTVLAEMLLAEPLFGSGADLDILLRIRDVDLSVFERTDRRIPQDVERLIRLGLAQDLGERPTAAAFADGCDEVIRRRGFGHGPDKVARLLMRTEIVQPAPGAPDHLTGARVTSLLDTTGLSAQAEQLVVQLGATSPAIYTVRLADGDVVGPMSFPRLVQMVTSGQVHSATMVAKETSGFAPATCLPELTRFVTSPALSWRSDEVERATERGELGFGKLLPIVCRLGDTDAVGVLHLSDRERRKKIYFVDGRPEFVASTDRRELLGEYLVASGRCLRMEVEMALALLPRYGGRLGDALVGLGVLRPLELFRAITEQVRGRYLEAYRWRRGEWAFVPDVRSHEETFPLGYDRYELMRDAAQHVHIDEIAGALGAVREQVLVPSETSVPLAAFRLPPAWEGILRTVDGCSTPSGILARESARGGEPEDVYRSLYLGLSCHLIRTA